MPYVVDAPVLVQREVGPGCFLLELEAPAIAREAAPGQFVHVRVSTTLDPFLRRPLSIHRVDVRRGTLSLLYQVVGRGTALLATARPHQKINILGPLGRGFTILPPPLDTVLVAGGIGIAPLYFLAERLLAAGHRVTLLHGARSRDYLLLAEELFALPLTYIQATDDGSAGMRGTVVDGFGGLNRRPDFVYAAGPTPMLAALARVVQAMKAHAEFSLEERMGCGVGGCMCCSFKAREGQNWSYRRVCMEGPVYPADKVAWE
ncbi:MAG: Dihydroorotate dehydrogenase B (NAD(+)), electron transfer subunit [Clostridia bacterium 62_21]|nr:MAG: Dihydroorotate dehydrogenase B (NAD(+)), electron transfer subunit [Clostridia bacterium 62_21]